MRTRVQTNLTNIDQFVRDHPTRITKVISYHNLFLFLTSSALLERFPNNRDSAWSDEEKGQEVDLHMDLTGQLSLMDGE